MFYKRVHFVSRVSFAPYASRTDTLITNDT